MDKTPLKHKVSAVVRRHVLIKPIRHQRNYFDHEAACLSANTGGRLKIRLLLVAEGAPEIINQWSGCWYSWWGLCIEMRVRDRLCLGDPDWVG